MFAGQDNSAAADVGRADDISYDDVCDDDVNRRDCAFDASRDDRVADRCRQMSRLEYVSQRGS